MKPLPAGMIVHVKTQAMIVRSTHPLNPYWYRIQYPDGRQDVVPLSRLSWEEERAREPAGKVRHVFERVVERYKGVSQKVRSAGGTRAQQTFSSSNNPQEEVARDLPLKR